MASSLKFAIAVLLVAYLYARLQHGWYLDEPREAHMVRLGSKVVASDLLKRGRLWRDVTGGGERPRHNSLTNRPHWFLDSLLLLAGDIELNPGPLRKGVRPMPNVTFMGKFVMCDGTRCIGSKCTFPHSESEMYVWNLQKFGQPAQNAVQTGPGRLGKGIRPVPNVDFDGKFVLCDETRCIGSKCTFPHSEAEKYAWNLHRSGEPVQSGAAQKDAQQQQEQVTHAGETGMFEEISQSDSRQSAVQTARGGADIDQASHWETVARKKKLRNVYKQNDGPVSSARYRQDASPALKLPLTSGSYKQKFKALLYAEQNEHQKILETKYNGHCTLQQYGRGYKPYWLNSNEDRKFEYVRFGILTGLDNDKIAYVAQASSRLTISKNAKQVCKADVLRENISSVDEHLYIGFNEENSNLLETSVCIREEKEHVSVGFELKHFYFNSLRQAVDSLPDCVIQKICPTGGCFQVDSIPDDDLKCYEDHCSRDQFSALKVIASCSARSPPVIISGAFGTGKTRLLAIASRYFIDKERTASSSTRVLVCTQQWVSADFFLKCYHGLMTSRKDTEVYVVKDYGFLNPEWKNFYKTIDKFKIRIKELPQTTNLLVISTCLTAPKLLSKNAVPHGFFTHIMLDEGAQTREPEAIAPLRMATVDTKIVIAGDKNQVGPHVLVLGDEARGNGLAVSLQQRLEECYQSIGVQAKRHLATLNTSYRCHKDILELTEELFYDDVHFVMPTDQKTPTTHQLAPYPLLFVCSSVDSHANAIDKATNEIEADIVLNEVLRFSNPWPHLQWGLKDHLSQMCVISVSRKQLAVVKKLIKRRGIPKLSQLCCCPTYDIQGKEYHAVFLSTSEQTDDNGFTTNPTKSLCDPYIFNTAITRAQSLVVSVGNPFLLLKMENHDDMIKRHGNKRKCWTNYIMRCLQNDTITFPDSLDLTEVKKTSLLMQLKKDVEEVMCRRIQWTVDSQNKQTRDNHAEHIEQLQKVDSVHIEHPQSSQEDAAAESSAHSRRALTASSLESQDDCEYQSLTSTSTTGATLRSLDSLKASPGASPVVKKKQTSEATIPEAGDLMKIKATKGEQIGHGSYGYVCIMHAEGKKYAGKFFHDTYSLEENFHTKFTHEVILLSHLKNKHIVACCGVVLHEQPAQYCLLMEVMDISLHEYLNKSPPSVLTRVKILQDISVGLEYLHSQKVVHRDLTIKNVLLTGDNPPVAKISDFGNACVVDFEESSQTRSLTATPGTEHYMPPEALERGYDTKLDIFSFGHLSLATAIHTDINKNMKTSTYHDLSHQLKARSEIERRSEYFNKLPIRHPLRDLIKQCLRNDPRERPTAEDLVIAFTRLSTSLQTEVQERLVGSPAITDECKEKEDQAEILLDRPTAQSQSNTGSIGHCTSTPIGMTESHHHSQFCLADEIMFDCGEALCDSAGIEHTIQGHDITLKIPTGAVPVGMTLTLEYAVKMSGPFTYPPNMRPISATLWMCCQEITKLLKPIEVTMPHIIRPQASTCLEELEVGFAKANHSVSEGKHKFVLLTSEKQENYSEKNISYRTLYTTHCCFFSILSKDIDHKIAQNAGFCLSTAVSRPLKSPVEIHVIASYFLSTSLTLVEEQFSSCDYALKVCCTNFTFDDNETLKMKLIEPPNAKNITSSPEHMKVTFKVIDFFKIDRDQLELRCERKRYPPRVLLEAHRCNLPCKIKLGFDGILDDANEKVVLELLVDSATGDAACAGTLDPLQSTTTTLESIHPDHSERSLETDTGISGASSYVSTNRILTEFCSGRGLANPTKDSFSSSWWNIHNLPRVGAKTPIIAILDTGINQCHAAFICTSFGGCKVLTSASYIAGDAAIQDTDGHGTACAGIAAGYPFCKADNGVALGGVAVEAQLIICRVASNVNDFCHAPVSAALQALIELNNRHKTVDGIPYVDVVSMAFFTDVIPGCDWSDLLSELRKQGTICVAAAGNSGNREHLKYPAFLGHVISVGSHTDGGKLSDCSRDGADVYALGENVCVPDIRSDKTVLQTVNGITMATGLGSANGTSVAAPAVAGLIARLIEYGHHHFGNDNTKLQWLHNSDMVLNKILKVPPMRDDLILKPRRFFDNFGFNFDEAVGVTK